MDKEKRREYQKNYREENKDIIKQRKKDYNLNNKEKISAYNRKHGNEKVFCECGKKMNRSSLTNHRKRELHIHLLREKEIKEQKNEEKEIKEKEKEITEQKNEEKDKLIKIKIELEEQISNIYKKLKLLELFDPK